MKKILTSLLLAIFVLSACETENTGDGKIKVVTTVGMLADAVENVGGDLVEVQALMGPGVDPHLYKASAGDIGVLENADVVLYVGLHLEGKMTEVFESLAEKQNVVAVGEVLPKSELLPADPSVGGTYDPHVWFDVDLWSNIVPEVERVLSESDPENALVYETNAFDYMQRLEELDEWAGAQIQAIPEKSRLLVTAHDAFGYFGRAYDIEVHGIQGISTSSDYGLKDLENLINLIVERQVKAIFVESSVPRNSIESLEEGVRAEGWDVVIGGQLFSDAMGQPGTNEDNYVGMVEYNVITIVNALK